MTDLQAKELELLRAFVDVCEKLGLKYYLVCGSALGAVKYKGFIPWDDDVDVALKREDYDVFLREAQNLLPDGIFLQNHRTDPAYPHIFSKLRDSGTTYIEKSVAHLPINHGIYIDVFPLDEYPTGERERRRLERTKSACKKKLSCVWAMERGPKAKLGYLLRRALGYHKKTAAILDEYEAAITVSRGKPTELWCNHGNWQNELEYAPADQYGEGAIAEFEGIPVRVPEKFEAYLTQKYGDWRADLPPHQQIGHHFYTVCDVNKPYTNQ